MPRGRKPKADTKKVVTKKKKIEDVYEKGPISSYHIHHKEGIDQYTVYLWIYRVPVFIYVGDIGKEETTKFFNKEREKYGLKGEFDYSCAGRTLSESGFGHLIWIREHSITTLVHELLHVVQNRIRYCNMVVDDELQAYSLQGLIEQVMSLDKEHKFKFYKPLPLDD